MRNHRPNTCGAVDPQCGRLRIMGLAELKTLVDIVVGVATLTALILATPSAYKKLRVNPWLDMRLTGRWVVSPAGPLFLAEVLMKNGSATTVYFASLGERMGLRVSLLGAEPRPAKTWQPRPGSEI